MTSEVFQQFLKETDDTRTSTIERKNPLSFADANGKPEDLADPFSRLDIRVGKIVYIQEHPLAEKTFVNHVRYDDKNTKAVMCKIKGSYKKKELKKKLVILVMNVNYKVMYLESEAFILYARDKDKKIRELLEPPIDSEVGDRIIAPGIPFIPATRMPYIKPMKAGKKLLDEVTANMCVDSEGFAMYKGIRLTNVMNEMVTVPTLRRCPIQR